MTFSEGIDSATLGPEDFTLHGPKPGAGAGTGAQIAVTGAAIAGDSTSNPRSEVVRLTLGGGGMEHDGVYTVTALADDPGDAADHGVSSVTGMALDDDETAELTRSEDDLSLESAALVSDTTIDVTFSEGIDSATLGAEDFTLHGPKPGDDSSNGAALTISRAALMEPALSNPRSEVVRLTLAAALTLDGVYTVTALANDPGDAADDGVLDTTGGALARNAEAEVTRSEDALELESAALVDDTTIDVTFSEGIDSATLGAEDFTLHGPKPGDDSSNGAALTISRAALMEPALSNPRSEVVRLTLAAALTLDGVYTVTALANDPGDAADDGVLDTTGGALARNAEAEVTRSEDALELESATYVDDNTITLTFSEGIDSGTIDPEDFELHGPRPSGAADGINGAEVAIMGAELDGDSTSNPQSTIIRLTLAGMGMMHDGIYTVTALADDPDDDTDHGVHALSGEALAEDGTAEVSRGAANPPTLVSAVYIDDNTIRLTFSEGIDSGTLDREDFTLHGPRPSSAAEGVNGAPVEIMTARLYGDLASNPRSEIVMLTLAGMGMMYDGTYTVTALADDPNDAADHGVHATTGEALAEDGTAEVNRGDGPPTLESATYVSDVEVTLTFSEGLLLSSVGPDGFTLSGPSPASTAVSVTGASLDAAGPGNEHRRTVTLALQSPGMAIDGTYTVTALVNDLTDSDPDDGVLDTTGVPLLEPGTADLERALGAPTLVSATYVDDHNIRLAFSEGIDSASLGPEDFTVTGPEPSTTALLVTRAALHQPMGANPFGRVIALTLGLGGMDIDGTYTVTALADDPGDSVDAGVRSTTGEPLDNNGVAQVLRDEAALTFDLARARLVGGVTAFVLTFSDGLSGASVTLGTTITVADPDGNALSPTLSHTDGSDTVTLTFGSILPDGIYTATATTGILSMYNDALDEETTRNINWILQRPEFCCARFVEANEILFRAEHALDPATLTAMTVSLVDSEEEPVALSADTPIVYNEDALTITLNLAEDAEYGVYHVLTTDGIIDTRSIEYEPSRLRAAHMRQTSSCDDCTPPTLGLNDNAKRLVTGGFSYNGRMLDVEYYYTPMPIQRVNVGDENVATLKIYENNGPRAIRHAGIAFGLTDGQHFAESRASIGVDRSFEGELELTLDDPDNVIDDTSMRIEAFTSPCMVGADYLCLVVSIYHTFREPLEFTDISTVVWDDRRNAWQNFFNHGVEILGESLNPERGIPVNDGSLVLYPLVSGDSDSDADGLYDFDVRHVTYMIDGGGALYRLASDGSYRPTSNLYSMHHVLDESMYRVYGHATSYRLDRQGENFEAEKRAQEALAREIMARLHIEVARGGTGDAPSGDDADDPAPAPAVNYAGRLDALRDILAKEVNLAELAFRGLYPALADPVAPAP